MNSDADRRRGVESPPAGLSIKELKWRTPSSTTSQAAPRHSTKPRSPRFTRPTVAFPTDRSSTRPVPRPAAGPSPLYTSLRRVGSGSATRFSCRRCKQGSKEGSRRHRKRPPSLAITSSRPASGFRASRCWGEFASAKSALTGGLLDLLSAVGTRSRGRLCTGSPGVEVIYEVLGVAIGDPITTSAPLAAGNTSKPTPTTTLLSDDHHHVAAIRARTTRPTPSLGRKCLAPARVRDRPRRRHRRLLGCAGRVRHRLAD